MLEVVIPGRRYGEAKINSATAYRGCHCYIAGVDSDGYQLLQLPYTTAQGLKALYPVNKLRFEEDLSDTSDAVDKLTKGDMIVYYEGGEYITDKFVSTTFGMTAAYWANVDGSLSSADGKKFYKPGSSTAIGTMDLDKIYVASAGGILSGAVKATGAKLGYLMGKKELTHGDNSYIGFAVGVYYEDSSHPYLRYRIKPGRADTF